MNHSYRIKYDDLNNDNYTPRVLFPYIKSTCHATAHEESIGVFCTVYFFSPPKNGPLRYLW